VVFGQPQPIQQLRTAGGSTGGTGGSEPEPGRENHASPWGAPPLTFGRRGDEIGFEMAQSGPGGSVILTTPRINALGLPARIASP